MSIFVSYTPKYLYECTLRMINTLFVRPPSITAKPTSYFRGVLEAHAWIKKDLGEVLKEPVQSERPEPTIQQIHASLLVLETMLFGTTREFEKTLKGACLYTEYLEKRLESPQRCIIV